MKPLKYAARILLGLGAAITAVLLCEGAYSVWSGESLLRRSLGTGIARRAVMRDADRIAAASLTRGPYALDLDPEVGFLMKPGHTQRFVGVAATTDAFGQRVRVGATPAEEAARIVILGDSVAFGMGVADDETYAHALESLLAETLGPNAPRPVVTTVACPGWNTANATRYLRNHVDRIDPDIVLYLPVNNDLADGSVVTETGHQAFQADPVAGSFLPHVSNADYLDLYIGLAPRTPLARVAQVARLGSASSFDHVLRTGYTPESKRRWSAFAASVSELEEVLAARRARLATVIAWDEDFHRLAARALTKACPNTPLVFLFHGREAEDGLVDDPHPNPSCVRAGARLVAQFLIERRWIAGVGHKPLPPADPKYAAREAKPLAQEEGDRWYQRHLEAVSELLAPTVDLSDATGFHQVYGGLAPDGTAGPSLFVALKNDACRHLEIELAAIPEIGGYPLGITVSFRGEEDSWVSSSATLHRPADTATEAGATVTLVVPVPIEVRGEPCVDVVIRPSNWVVEQVEGVTRLAAFRLHRLRLR